MAYLYSPSTKGFYDTAMHYSTIPEDTIVLTTNEYSSIFETLQTKNKEIVVTEGKIALIDTKINLTWASVKAKRNKLLSDSDYTQMPDWPGNKQVWADYRQALRDITETFDSPEKVVWPTKPNDK